MSFCHHGLRIVLIINRKTKDLMCAQISLPPSKLNNRPCIKTKLLKMSTLSEKRWGWGDGGGEGWGGWRGREEAIPPSMLFVTLPSIPPCQQ
jgi:hypothetical protein